MARFREFIVAVLERSEKPGDFLWIEARSFPFTGKDQDAKMRAAVGEWFSDLVKKEVTNGSDVRRSGS